MKLLLLLAALCCARVAMAEAQTPPPRGTFNSVALPAATRVDGISLSEISGLAWDPEAQWLYAVSDSGNLFRLKLHIENGALRAVVPVAAVAMQRSIDAKGGLSGFDAEGLALRPSTALPNSGTHRIELLVATERTPRVWRVDPSGALLGELALPPPLADPKHYAERNSMLESVAIHPVHGLLVAPERPMSGENPLNGHRIHTSHRHWNLEALDPEASHLKAMEVLEDGQLLVLERSGSGRRLVNALRSTALENCTGPAPCPMQTLMLMDRAGGADNFEGMAYLGQGQVLLVSDNRGKKGSATVFLLVNLR